MDNGDFLAGQHAGATVTPSPTIMDQAEPGQAPSLCLGTGGGLGGVLGLVYSGSTAGTQPLIHWEDQPNIQGPNQP